MVIKNRDYYLSLDLNKAAEIIKNIIGDRGKNEVFREAINCLVFSSNERVVTGDEIVSVLGKPDRISQNDKGTVLEYDWTGHHGPFTYTSTTPFQLVNNICRGIRGHMWDEE